MRGLIGAELNLNLSGSVDKRLSGRMSRAPRLCYQADGYKEWTDKCLERFSD